MTVKSHAGWLPAEGDGAAGSSGDPPAQHLPAAEALRSGEAQLISGRARVDTDGIEQAHGETEPAPVSQARALSEAEIADGGFFRERVIEVAETHQEAVVEKEVVVREEVVLRKETAEHTQTIQDTVRRTEVEVDELRAPDGGEAPRTG
jgi:stress response protein YsnF